MERVKELILFILDRAHKEEIKNLSSFQLFKIPYLIQVLSLKYTGTKFLPNTTFIRDKNGPISTDIYSAIKDLTNNGYIGIEESRCKDYEFTRCGHKLIKKLPKLSFTGGEIIFLDNFLSKLLPLSQKRLKAIAYSTEPMKEIIKQEKNSIKKGQVIDLSTVIVDSDVVDAYSDAS